MFPHLFPCSDFKPVFGNKFRERWAIGKQKKLQAPILKGRSVRDSVAHTRVQSQRDCALCEADVRQPRVARNELPWVRGCHAANPERVAACGFTRSHMPPCHDAGCSSLKCALLLKLYCSGPSDDSPSPWGEGWGKGEFLLQPQRCDRDSRGLTGCQIRFPRANFLQRSHQRLAGSR